MEAAERSTHRTARAHAEAVLVRDAWNMNGMTHIDGSYGSYLHPSVDMTHARVVLCRVGFGLGTYDIGDRIERLAVSF